MRLLACAWPSSLFGRGSDSGSAELRGWCCVNASRTKSAHLASSWSGGGDGRRKSVRDDGWTGGEAV